jgi:hypothetical protein
MTITERVIAEVRRFEGYSKTYYCAAANVTAAQFDSVARQHLQRYEGRTYVTWYLKDSKKIPGKTA